MVEYREFIELIIVKCYKKRPRFKKSRPFTLLSDIISCQD